MIFQKSLMILNIVDAHNAIIVKDDEEFLSVTYNSSISYKFEQTDY